MPSTHLSERLRVPPGPVHGGRDARCVLLNGPTLVRGRHCALYHPRQQLETRVRVLGSGGAAQVSRHQRAALHRPHDLHAHGLLRLHDVRAEGQTVFVIFGGLNHETESEMSPQYFSVKRF